MSVKDLFLEVFADKRIHEKYTRNQIVEMVQVTAKAKGQAYSNDSILPSDYCYNRSNAGIIFDASLHLFVLGENDEYEYLGANYNYKGEIINRNGETGEVRKVGQWIDGKPVFTIRTVNSVWLGAAILAFNKYYQTETPSKTDMYFSQSNIVKQASYIHGSRVPATLASSQCVATRSETNYNYLISGEGDSETERRLSFSGEFEGKNEKPSLNSDWTVRTYKGNIPVKELVSFIENEYTILMKGNNSVEKIDVESIVKYLMDHAGEAYKKPDKAGENVEHMQNLHDEGVYARERFVEIGRAISNSFQNYEMGAASNWVNQGQTVPDYFWIEFKKKAHKDSQSSISLFAWRAKGEVLFYLAVEARDSNCKPEDFKRHNRLINKKLENDLLYYLIEDKQRQYSEVDYSYDELVKRYESGQILKIRVQFNIDKPYTSDNTEKIIQQLYKGFSLLEPYYEEAIKETNEYYPTLKEYDPGIATEQYLKLFQNEEFVKFHWMDSLYYLYKMGGEATCRQIAEKYGNTSSHYNMNAQNIAKGVNKATDCPLRKSEDGSDIFWPILFQGKDAKSNETGVYYWKMRNPLKEAIKIMEANGVFDEFTKPIISNIKYDKNMILYGPPGTGKTYNSINYAVAIVENRSIDQVANENHSEVIERYNQYKQKGLIAFTTFHQSYGYEEFIEGIKPIMLDACESNTSDIQYEVKSGKFKEFCERAQSPIVEKQNHYGIKNNPVIWKVSLQGSGENAVRRDCFNNGRIRIGWDDYGKEINEQTIYTYGGQVVLDSFIDQMEIGDIVFTLYNNRQIDAIGVVKGNYEWLEDVDEYKRSRKVQWIFYDKNEDIIDINGGKELTQSSVYRLRRIQLSDVINILAKHHISLDEEVKENENNYVFIIDEINRGNISKIFGELITLIEPTKRLGAEEAMTAALPYSSKPFGVPNNVYLLGTMNTADRSIALMDTALRRRFQFIEMMPASDLLAGVMVDSIDIKRMFETMNMRIEYLFDREHTIGHSYLLGLKSEATIKNLAGIFKNSIIPLLQEYFYEDYSKIQLVLGDNNKKEDEFKFIKDVAVKIKEVFKGKLDVDLPERKYSIQRNAFDLEQSYIQIYE